MNTPDITRAQGGAVAALIAAHAAGIHDIEFIALAAFAAVVVLADAHIRGKRNDRIAIAGPETVVTLPTGHELSEDDLDELDAIAADAAADADEDTLPS
jgi:hypothetical protein